MEGYETTKEAAVRLGVNDSRVRQLILEGRMPGTIKAGRDWLIPNGLMPTPPEKSPKIITKPLDTS